MTELLEEYLKHINEEENLVLVYDEKKNTNVRCTFIISTETGPSRGPFKADVSVWNLLTYVNEKTYAIINELTKNTP